MATGLVALLDDIAGIARIAASSLDDVAAAAGKAGAKAAGVVIDDTAVTPRYVVGFTPDRELPIIAKIALGSLRNKLLFLLPAAMLLSAFAPWAITPLLMVGGAFLCFEGAEKLVEVVTGHVESADEEATGDAKMLENQKVAGAIRTDLILSAEIMAIALAQVAANALWLQAVALALVGIAVTAGVYGAVAIIVKMDDIGLHLAKSRAGATRAIGRGLVRAMPLLLRALSAIGTAAMMWVGGGIIVHGLDHFHLTSLPAGLHHMSGAAGAMVPAMAGAIAWIVQAIGAGLLGLVVGLAVVGVLHLRPRRAGH